MQAFVFVALLLPLALGWSIRERNLASFKRSDSYDCGPVKAAWYRLWEASRDAPGFRSTVEAGVIKHLQKVGLISGDNEMSTDQMVEATADGFCDIARAKTQAELAKVTGETPETLAQVYPFLQENKDRILANMDYYLNQFSNEGDRECLRSFMDLMIILDDSGMFDLPA